MWIITDDFADEGKMVGTSSRNYTDEKRPSLTFRFRLLNDDGEVHYEGLADDCDSQWAFAPLDDFGKGYAGCTEIHYFDGNVWRQL